MRPDGTETDTRYTELQARLGHTFRNAALCETAMTHTSWLNEAGKPERSDNERLEFLGDAVVDLVVSDLLKTPHAEPSTFRMDNSLSRSPFASD